MSDSPPILARGALEKTPLAEFLVKALDERLEGTLILQTPDGQKHAVLFLRGAPAKARLTDTPVYLGDVIAELELLPRSVCVSTRKKAQAAGKPHGQVLLDEGHLDQTGLYIALRNQLHKQMLHLCDLPEKTVFGLYKANYLANWGPAAQWRVKPLPLVWRALVDHVPAPRRDTILERIGGHMLRMRFEAPVSRYAMTKNEANIVNMLKAKPQTLSELEGCGIGAPESIRKVVCALVVSRQLEGSARQGHPVGFSEPPESPNSTPPPSMRAARRSITAPRAPRVGTTGPHSGGRLPPSAASSDIGETPQSKPASSEPREGSARSEAFREVILQWQNDPPSTFYQVLGVPEEADASAVQRAFFQLARQWHPDKLPADLADLKPIVTKAFSRMGEAHQVLTDPQRRAEYDAKLKDAPDGEQEQVAAILEASGAFQRAEILVKKKDFSSALKEARSAWEHDPTQADYLALVTWLRSVTAEGSTEELISELNRAVEMDPQNVRARWYRGQLYKKANKSTAAVRDFKKVLELKPNHVDAKREIRVHQMRRKTDPKAGKSTGGLFGRFGKK